MRKKMNKFIFDQPYHGVVSFDSRNCVFNQNQNLFVQNLNLDIPTFPKSTRSTNVMQVFKDLFEMGDYELFFRMDEDKIMKTLKFINDNVKKNNLFCLATISTRTEQYFLSDDPRSKKQSEVIFGQVIVFVIENVQKPRLSSHDMDRINSLLRGMAPNEFSQKNVKIMTNYRNFCKKSIDEAASFFRFDLKEQSSIPMFVVIDYSSINETKNGDFYFLLGLKFKINTLQRNFYQSAIVPEYTERDEHSMDLFDSVCFKTKQFSNQGPFHKWKHDIMHYMEDLAQLKHQIKKKFLNFNAKDQHAPSVYHCFSLLQHLIVKDYIPNQHSWILVNYNNLHGQNKSIILLRRECEKNWEKQLVITSKDWIASLKEFCGDKNKHNFTREIITLKDYVWLYDENDVSNVPYLLIQNEEFAIGICEEIEENSWVCEHLNMKENIQYFCVKCKKNVEMKENSFTCYCGIKSNFKKLCLFCWRSNLSTSIDPKDKDRWEHVGQIEGSETDSHQQSNEGELTSKKRDKNSCGETGTSHRNVHGNELRKQLEEEKLQKQKMELACQNKDKEIEELKKMEKTLREDIRKLNEKIVEHENKSKTQESTVNEVLQKNDTLIRKNQQLKRKTDENEQTINNLRMEIAQLLGVKKDLRDKLAKATNNELMLEEEKQKLNAEIMKLRNELKTHESEFNETLKGITTLTEENQQLKRKNNENENNLEMQIAELLVAKKDLNDKLTKANKQIEKLENPKTYTIVVVGATGVGKSTLISAMENYLKWPKLEDAAKHLNELEIRIPVQFTVTRKTGQSQVVSAGFADDKKQKNENFNNAGESVTQKPKVHLFKYGNDTVRIIDTPGLADTRGSDQDEINLKLIQKMVKSQEQIHGICIFIKSNDLKLTPQFEMTVRQLLSVFPKSALNNVFFFFTHCVGTFFGVGDVMSPLKELQKKFEESHGSTFSLDWNKMHCVDSESFRYLVCRKQNVEYSTRPEADFYYAWDKSAEEISAFFEILKTIKPIPANKIEASRKLAKWTDAMKQKESLAKPEQREAYSNVMDSLKFMSKKHTLVLNKSELKTNIQDLTEFGFCEAIDEFLNVAEDGGRRLQKCKEIIKTLESE